jgi:hypothetical protein
MSNAQEENGVSGAEKRIPYGQYEFDLYGQALVNGKKPIITTDPNKLERAAQDAMSPESFGYVLGGAGEGLAIQNNRLAFRQWGLIPRMLRPTQPRNLSVQLFGKTYGKWCTCCILSQDWN